MPIFTYKIMTNQVNSIVYHSNILLSSSRQAGGQTDRRTTYPTQCTQLFFNNKLLQLNKRKILVTPVINLLTVYFLKIRHTSTCTSLPSSSILCTQYTQPIFPHPLQRIKLTNEPIDRPSQDLNPLKVATQKGVAVQPKQKLCVSKYFCAQVQTNGHMHLSTNKLTNQPASQPSIHLSIYRSMDSCMQRSKSV